MSNLQVFLADGWRAIAHLNKLFPTIKGPVQNPLRHITNQLSALQSHTKSLKLLRNILMASAMLLCLSVTFKPIMGQAASVDADEEGAWAQLVYDAARRFVFDPHDSQSFNSPFMKRGNGRQRSSRNYETTRGNEVERHGKTAAPVPINITGHPLFHAIASQHSL